MTHKRVNFFQGKTYKKPLSEVDRFLAAHREYLAKHYAVGDFIASGPQTPRVGGVIMIKAENHTVVDAIIAQDPFNINGIADYQIVEFTPTMVCDDISQNHSLTMPYISIESGRLTAEQKKTVD